MWAPRVPSTSVLFVSQASIEHGVVQAYGLRKRLEPVKNCRGVGKKDMRYNDAMPRMRVDPESYTVEADGKVCTAEPATELPLGQAYFAY
jgi:urease